MKSIKVNSIVFGFIFGFGYWKNVYSKEKTGIEGYSHNIILPFMVIQLATLFYDKNETNEQ